MYALQEKKDISNSPSEIEKFFTLEYIPQGYTLDSSFQNPTISEQTWKNSKSKIVFSQYLLSNKSTLDIENSNYKTFYTTDFKVVCIEKNGLKIFYWNTSEYTFDLVVSNEIPTEECINMINSLTIQEKELK